MTLPADPANADSEAKTVSQAGQVWFPDSSFKTAQVDYFVSLFDFEKVFISLTSNPWTLMYLLCIYHVFTVYLLCVYHVFTVYLPCLYHVFTIYLPYIYLTFTMYLPCIRQSWQLMISKIFRFSFVNLKGLKIYFLFFLPYN